MVLYLYVELKCNFLQYQQQHQHYRVYQIFPFSLINTPYRKTGLVEFLVNEGRCVTKMAGSAQKAINQRSILCVAVNWMLLPKSSIVWVVDGKVLSSNPQNF